MPLPIAGLISAGLPVLTRLVGGALDKIDHPAARGAAAALADVGDAITGGEITPEQIAEAHRHAERMAEIEAGRETDIIESVNATMRAEAASTDPWARRWRPFFGYVVATTWGALMLALGWVIVDAPDKAPAVINAMTALSFMWGIALAVLGVSVVKRSHDKQVAAGNAPAGLAGAASAIGGMFRARQ